MTELIKQRLVGLLLVVIAGVVFIPDLLDGKKQQTKEEFKKIPPRPMTEETPIITEFPKDQVINAISKAPVLSDEQAQDELEQETDNLDKITQVNLTQQASVNDEQTSKQPVLKQQTPNASTEPAPKKPTRQVEPVEFEKTAWVLRLGTFRNKPNVDALLEKLESAGVTTFVKPVEAKAGTLYRVFVGPEFEVSTLESAQKTLKELTGLDGKITEFHPVN